MTLLNSLARTTIRPQHAATFSSSPSSTILDGPLVVYRFLGTLVDTATRKKSRNNPHGVFWFGSSVYEVLRDDFREAALSGERIRNPAQTILKGVREGLAVTYEWNTLDLIIRMTIPRGDTVSAWTGLTAWQLEWLSKPQGRTLSGGFVQYVIYDVASMPTSVLKQYTLQTIWREFSQGLPR